MKTYVVDIETDGLISSKIHVMSAGYQDDNGEWKIISTDDYDKMKAIMGNEEVTIIGHNFIAFDAVEIERVLGIEVKAKIIDTLALAWYIYPERIGSYGLAAFGEDYGIPKPKIDDWEGLTYDQYAHRCEEDVKINIKVWEDINQKLLGLYDNERDLDRFMKYLMFKMECVAKQRKIQCKVDVDKVKENIDILESLKEPKIDRLVQAMPLGRVIKSKPKTMFKQDGSPSIRAEKWYAYLRENNLPLDTEEIRDDANPASNKQLKDWLESLGWKPRIFKEGANGNVAQVRDDNRELCESVLKLVDVEPAIADLDGLSVINHRLGVLNSFLDTVDDKGYTVASMSGFTNTLRLRHSRPIANLPGVTRQIKDAMDEGMSKIEAISHNLRDGQIIRECIVAPEGYKLCGSDVTSLEDNTKRHYMWDYDPEYVTDQMVEGFDPHLDLAIKAGAIKEEDVPQLKAEGKLKPIRDIYKMANYSCIYGVGAAKLADSTGLSVNEAREVIAKYWDRNWSIKQLPNDMIVKTVGQQQWLLNPLNKFWYSIRAEKDIFSTLNQGTGAYVFDCWVKIAMAEGITPFLQYHDEIVSLCPIGQEERFKEVLEDSMYKVNELLKLNIEITVDVQFGHTYADVH
uniref:DNA polymerase A n=1 Tax=uncultured virus TaxID=340016 RepID=A0A240F7E5_9VIRU|nr:DNA polymerase A [uncultured virus]